MAAEYAKVLDSLEAINALPLSIREFHTEAFIVVPAIVVIRAMRIPFAVSGLQDHALGL
jgi:hypothetical protein